MDPAVAAAIIGLGGSILTAAVTIWIAFSQRSKRIDSKATSDEVLERVLRQFKESEAKQPPPTVDTYALYDFDDNGDKGLQDSRIDLAKRIESVIDAPLTEDSAGVVNALVISQHNAALRYHATADNAPKHIEEAEAMYDHLQSRLLRAPLNKYTKDVAFALGIMNNNMVEMLRTD